MKAIRVSAGDYVDYIPPGSLPAGSVVVQGSLVGIADRPLAASVPGALAVRGIFDVAKAPGTVGVGALIYWDATNQLATTSASGNTLMGKAIKGELGGASTVRILMNQ